LEYLMWLCKQSEIRIPEFLTRNIEVRENLTSEAELQLEEHVGKEVAKQRKRLNEELERVFSVRQKQLGSSRDGKADSGPPVVEGKSRVCVCELCKVELGIFNPALPGPLRGEHITSLNPVRTEPGWRPFPEKQEWKDMRCPVCTRQPWGEGFLVAVTDGFRTLAPAPEQDEVAGQSGEEASAGFVGKGETITN
jgi:hypothetical protein